MDIVPVIDLRGGRVVHAKRGERASYAPLRSGLLEGSEPLAVLAALLAAVARAGRSAPAAYVADLDALLGGEPQWSLLEALRHASPVPLWLDAGFDSLAAAVAAGQRGFVPVVGSESLRTLAGLPGNGPGARDWVLSLDRDADGPRDRAGVLRQPQLWPESVIAMDLTRVGSEQGGVGHWLESCMRLADGHRWVAAGGVRGQGDLQALQAAGARAALVATALHAGALSG